MQYDRETLIKAIEWDREEAAAKLEREAQEFEAKAEELRNQAFDYTHGDLKKVLYDLLGKIEEFPNHVVYTEDLEDVLLEPGSGWRRVTNTVSKADIETQEVMAVKRRGLKPTGDSSLLLFLKSISHTKVSQSALEKAGFNIKAGKLIGSYLGREAE